MPDAIRIAGDQQNFESHDGSRQGGFAARVAGTDHDAVKMFVLMHDTEAFP
jgi:hypothetical protein